MGQAVTIAIRYGAVRRQGNNNEQLLHYQSHQYNLFPVISTVYGCKFLYQYLDNYWAESLEIQKQGANGQSEFLKRSSDMHNLTAGLKSFVGMFFSFFFLDFFLFFLDFFYYFLFIFL